MKLRARRRPDHRDAAVDVAGLFARQSTECSGGTQFYRCALNNFAGCCAVDPCSNKDGCPDHKQPSDTQDEDEDEDEDEDKDKDKDDNKTKDETKVRIGQEAPTAIPADMRAQRPGWHS